MPNLCSQLPFPFSQRLHFVLSYLINLWSVILDLMTAIIIRDAIMAKVRLSFARCQVDANTTPASKLPMKSSVSPWLWSASAPWTQTHIVLSIARFTAASPPSGCVILLIVLRSDCNFEVRRLPAAEVSHLEVPREAQGSEVWSSAQICSPL